MLSSYTWTPSFLSHPDADTYAMRRLASFNFLARWMHGVELYKYGLHDWAHGGSVICWTEEGTSEGKCSSTGDSVTGDASKDSIPTTKHFKGLVRGDGYVLCEELKAEYPSDQANPIAISRKDSNGKFLVGGFDSGGRIAFDRSQSPPTFARNETYQIIQVSK